LEALSALLENDDDGMDESFSVVDSAENEESHTPEGEYLIYK